MNKITKDGRIMHTTHRGKTIELKTRLNILRGMHYSTELDPGTTLRAIFKAMRPVRGPVSVHSGTKLSDFYDEMLRPKPKKKTLGDAKDPMTRLVLSRVYRQAYRFDRKDHPDADGSISTEFSGKSKKAVYSIMLTPVNEIADLPVVLEPLCKVEFLKTVKTKAKNVKYRHVRVGRSFSVRVPFTLQEIFTEISWELGWTGTPADREKLSETLKSRAKDAKAHPERMVSSKEVFARIRKKQKSRGKAATIATA